MKILVLGSTGGTGSEVVKQGLAAGHTITAFARTPEKITIQDKRLRVVKGDAQDVKTLLAAMPGHDAIIIALGPKNMKDMKTLSTATTHNIIEAARRAGVKRVVLMSSFMVFQDQLKFGTKLITSLSKGMVADKVRSEEELRNSGLDWTIVYPTKLTNEQSTKYRAVARSEKLGIRNAVPRTAVANALLTYAGDDRSIGKDIAITAK